MRHPHRKAKKKIRVDLENLPAFFFKEGNNYVAVMPALDLSTCGETLEEAQKMAAEAALIFIGECAHMGTLEEVFRYRPLSY